MFQLQCMAEEYSLWTRDIEDDIISIYRSWALGLWHIALLVVDFLVESFQIEKRMEKLKKSKANDSQSKVKEEAEKAALGRIHRALLDGKPARLVDLSDFERDAVKHLFLLCTKPMIYVANVAEFDLAYPGNNPHVQEVESKLTELKNN